MSDPLNIKPKKKTRRQDVLESPFGGEKFPLPDMAGKQASVTIPGRPPSELNYDAQRSINSALAKHTHWEPKEEHERIKARFYRRLEEKSHQYDRDAALHDVTILEELTGTTKIHALLKDERFREWFLDEHYFEDMMFSLRGKSINRLREIIDSDVAMDADAIKAIKMVLEQTNPKKQEMRFIDETLNRMPAEQVRSEQARLSAALGELDD